MKLIPLGHGIFAKVDDEDYQWLIQWKWCFCKNYAVRGSKRINGKQKTIYMHREILTPIDGFITDHINRDTLDNRRSNLRRCTKKQNMMNSNKPRRNTSGYKGVSYARNCNKFVAYIKIDGNHHCLGYFSDPVDAARTYDRMAIQQFGQFASINFPNE